MDSFDSNDISCCHYGTLSRDDANSILHSEQPGVFLVRNSTTSKGDLVLCVKEVSKVSHYIIQASINPDSTTIYKIGDLDFDNMRDLLDFYKHHLLDTTQLIRPVKKLKVKAKFPFKGKDPDDLPFVKDEILTIIVKEEEKWWKAVNSQGTIGLIPVPYIEEYKEENDSSTSVSSNLENSISSPNINNVRQPPKPVLPAPARVIKNRDPNAYDKTALKLRIGDLILVTAMHATGQWEGEVNGQKGFFPFMHIEFIEPSQTSPNTNTVLGQEQVLT